MKALYLTLVCHPATAAQRAGRLPGADDDLLAPPLLPPGQAMTEAFTRIISAPERRARQAAQAWGPYEVAPALADLALGRWAGVPLKQLPADELAAWLSDVTFDGHGGESFEALRARTGGWLAALAGEQGRWLALTHPWVIRAALAWVLGLSYPAAQAIDIQPGGRIALACSDRWRVVVAPPR